MIEPILPMLLTKAEQPFDSDQYIFEFKFDGVRMLSYTFEDCQLFNRNLKNKTANYPQIAKKLQSLPYGTVLDGEIIAIDEQSKQNFYQVISQNFSKNPSPNHSIHYMVFDILMCNGKELFDVPLIKRKKILAELAANHGLNAVDFYPQNGIELFEIAKQNQLEGIVAKEIDGIYIAGSRAKGWQKIKCMRTITTKICGYSTDRYSICLAIEDNGEPIYVGNAGTGLTQKEWSDLYTLLSNLQTSNKIKNFEGKNIQFVHPLIEAEIKYFEREPSGKLRHPTISQIMLGEQK